MAPEDKVATLDRTLPALTEPLQRVSTEVTSDVQLGSVIGGQYLIEERMGKGGMGAVYRALQLSVNRAVAVKLIAAGVEQSPEHVERFRREAEALSQLRHPNTVHLLDFGLTDQGKPFMVMELLVGTDLERHLADTGPLPLPEALHIARQIAQSLCEAHALGIVHRDLKPGNIFLAQVEGGERFAKVMDFGVAGFARDDLRSTLTVKGTVLGTAAYMSPEQAQGFAVDPRADLYSLGVLLFEMLAGRPPFQANSAVSLLVAHVSEAPPRLRDVCPHLMELERVQALLDKLLAKQPEERPVGAPEVIALIDRLLLAIGAGLSAPEAIVAASLRRRRRRRTRYLGMSSGALLLAATGLLLEPPPRLSHWYAQTFPGLEGFIHQNLQRARSLRAQAARAIDGALPHAAVSVTIASVPSGATVLLAGAELGHTPYPLQLKQKTVIQLALPAFETETVEVDPNGDPNLVVKLIPLPPYRGALAPDSR